MDEAFASSEHLKPTRLAFNKTLKGKRTVLALSGVLGGQWVSVLAMFPLFTWLPRRDADWDVSSGYHIAQLPSLHAQFVLADLPGFFWLVVVVPRYAFLAGEHQN